MRLTVNGTSELMRGERSSVASNQERDEATRTHSNSGLLSTTKRDSLFSDLSHIPLREDGEIGTESLFDEKRNKVSSTSLSSPDASNSVLTQASRTLW